METDLIRNKVGTAATQKRVLFNFTHILNRKSMQRIEIRRKQLCYGNVLVPD